MGKDVKRFEEGDQGFEYRGQRKGAQVNASLKDGVLELRAAKAEEQKPKAIPISLN